MTRDQILEIVGKNSIILSGDDNIVFNKAPKPHDAFESWALLISPKDGLVKVIAVGKTKETDDSGIELKQAFDSIVEGIANKYGKPKSVFSSCGGSNELECKSENWMLSLKDKNRQLSDFWEVSSPNHVHLINVQARASSLHSGYVNVGFEFEKFNQYEDEKKKDQQSYGALL